MMNQNRKSARPGARSLRMAAGLALLPFLTLAMPTQALAQDPIALVLASTSAESWKGRLINGGEAAQLEAGAFIVIVASDGQVRAIDGPLAGPLDATLGVTPTVPGLLQELGGLYKHLSRHSTRLFACGGLSSARRQPAKPPTDPAAIDLARGNAFLHCRTPRDPLALTNRPKGTSNAWKLKVIRSSMVARLVWPEGRQTLGFPSLPPPQLVRDGTQFLLEPDAAPGTTPRDAKFKITLREVAAPAPTPGVKAMLFSQADCSDQARAILERAIPVTRVAQVAAFHSRGGSAQCPK